jgi:Flp pilus assembly protein TadB
MRVQFEYTLDDVVDVQLRALKRSAAARAWRWRDLVATSLLSGALLFALIPGETASRLIVGTVGLIMGALFYPIVNESTVKRRLRKLFQENAGPEKVSICEVELCESAAHTRQNGMEIIYRWENVKEVRRQRIQSISMQQKVV